MDLGYVSARHNSIEELFGQTFCLKSEGNSVAFDNDLMRSKTAWRCCTVNISLILSDLSYLFLRNGTVTPQNYFNVCYFSTKGIWHSLFIICYIVCSYIMYDEIIPSSSSDSAMFCCLASIGQRRLVGSPNGVLSSFPSKLKSLMSRSKMPSAT